MSKRRIDEDPEGGQPAPEGEPSAKRRKLTPLVTAVVTERAPGSQFHTQFVRSFVDTGKLPHFLTEEKQRQIAAELEKVIRKEELARREREYEKLDLRKDRAGMRGLVDESWADLMQHCDSLAESNQRYIKELFKQKQVKALEVKDGSLNILFTPVGHGDCTVIQTPAGRTVVIDCGSSRGYEPVRVGEELPGLDRDSESEFEDLRVHQRIQALLGKRNRLDFLILTHPDADHHNKLESIFAEASIGQVYHSAQFSEYGKSNWVIEKMAGSGEEEKEELDLWTAQSQIKQITFCYSSKIKGGKRLNFITEIKDLNGKSHIPEKYDKNNPDQLDCLDEDGGLLIWAEGNCRISILSSNVNQEHQKDWSSAKNRGSVVVLIKAFGKKILICGDATFNTEEELITRYGDKISNIDVLRVGHHGSGLTSSGLAFTSHVRAKMAWISESYNSSFHSPSIEVIKRLCNHAETSTEPHDLCFWSGSSYWNFNNHQLSKLRVDEQILIGGTSVKFTKELIDSYARKQVHVTATSLNPMIVIPFPEK